MIKYPEPGDDFEEWARQIVQLLTQRDQELAQVQNVGQIGEFLQLPTGWLPCAGGTFEQPSFPVLAQLLDGTTLPTLSSIYDPSFVVGIKAG